MSLDFGWGSSMPHLPGAPAGSLVRAGGYKNHLYALLGEVRASGTTQTTATAVARILNPSKALNLVYGVVFEPANPITIDSFQTAAWTHRVFVPATAGFREVLGQALETGIALPKLYEADSGAPGILITATLAIPLDASAAAIPGRWLARAWWEPTVPMCEADVRGLFAMCSISRDSGPTIPLAP